MKKRFINLSLLGIGLLVAGLSLSSKVCATQDAFLYRQLKWSGNEATAKTQTRTDTDYFTYLPVATIFIYNSSNVCIGSASQTAPTCYNTAQASASNASVHHARGYHYITDGINQVGFIYEDRNKGSNLD